MLLRAAVMPPAAGEGTNPVRAVCGQWRAFTLARPLRMQGFAAPLSSPVLAHSSRNFPVVRPLNIRVLTVQIPASVRCAAACGNALAFSAFRRAVIQARHRPEQ